jgi:hypothetical protein
MDEVFCPGVRYERKAAGKGALFFVPEYSGRKEGAV